MSSTQQLLLGEGAGGSGPPVYIEDVFSTYLYTGTGSAQTITNGIDLSTKGGLVWTKARSNSNSHNWVDSARGADYYLVSNTTAKSNSFTAGGDTSYSFNTNGFTTSNFIQVAQSAYTYVSWTFRKQPKFFDVVTYLGTGSVQNISHNLGSVPGFIIIKECDNADLAWTIYHRSLGNTKFLLFTSDAAVTSSEYWNNTSPTSTQFTVGTNSRVNLDGSNYVAYVFAHDAGGFGLAGTDNVISCGAFTTDGSGNATVSLGYEPQWVLFKSTDNLNSWAIYDNMRGMPVGTTDRRLLANTGGAEAGVGLNAIDPTATEFSIFNESPSANFIYIAIRRGPMRVPTSGTSVFGLNARTGTGADATVTGGAGVSDAVLIKNRGSAVNDLFAARLTGTGYFVTSATTGEVAAGATILQANPWDVMDGVKVGTTSTITNASANTFINYLFDRAPGFFDVVCYTGTGTGRTVTHNLSAVPEMMIVKKRSGGAGGVVYTTSTGNDVALALNGTGSSTGGDDWNTTTPTATVFSVGTADATNTSASTYIAYLFATCAGVSKVGSYTGNGTTQTINCGFGAGGARFVLIRRSNNGDWYVFDTARGMTLLTDPYFRLNDNSAETATLGSVTTVSTGFALDATVLVAINGSGNPYIFLAIA